MCVGILKLEFAWILNVPTLCLKYFLVNQKLENVREILSLYRTDKFNKIKTELGIKILQRQIITKRHNNNKFRVSVFRCEEQSVWSQWIKRYGYLRTVQNANIRKRLNVTVLVITKFTIRFL